MATPPNSNRQESPETTNEKLRDAMNDAYAALEGQRNLDSFNAFTFEDATDLLISKIEGDGTTIRPNQIEKVKNINQQLQNAVTQLLALPAHTFVEPSKTEDVNTPPDQYDPDQEESTTVNELPA